MFCNEFQKHITTSTVNVQIFDRMVVLQYDPGAAQPDHSNIQVPLNLVTATTLMLVKSGQLEDRGLVFGLLSVFLLVAVLVAASIQAKEEKRE